MKQNLYRVSLFIFCGFFINAINAMDKDRNGCLQKTSEPTPATPKIYEYTPQNSSSTTNNSSSNRSEQRAVMIFKHMLDNKLADKY